VIEYNPKILADSSGLIPVDGDIMRMYLDTLGHRIYHFNAFMELGAPNGLGGWGDESISFDSADIFSYGKDYRTYMTGAEMRNNGFISSGGTYYRIGNGQFERQEWKDSIPDDAWFEMIFYGSIPLGVSAPHAITGFSVYPNPVSNFVTVELPDFTSTIEVRDILGRKQAVSFVERTSDKCVLDLAMLPSGMYYILAGKSTCKILKK
jgi:hypothetical protein